MDLIATCARHYENDAGLELVNLLEILGDKGAIFSKTGISGIITATTSLGASNAIALLRTRLLEEPWEFRYILRVIPVHATSVTIAQNIAKAAKDLCSCIKENDTYRITIEKRNSEQSASGIISAIADTLDNKVCLENPDWIILVETLGGITGIAVIRPDGLLAVVREKMAASSEDEGSLN